MIKNSRIHNKGMILWGILLILVFAVGCFLKSGYIFCKYEDSAEFAQNEARRQGIIEGDIIDRNGNIIMKPTAPVKEKNEPTVVHPAYSHLLGFNSTGHGRSALRKLCYEDLYSDLETGKGATIQLTIDDNLQSKAFDYIKNGVDGSPIRGSIVVLDAKTGDILTMTSRNYMDFEPETIDENYKKYVTINEFFLNYPTDVPEAPGSVYKLVTACAAIEKGYENYIYNDVNYNGKYLIDGKEELTVYNHKAVRENVFGDINMQLALDSSLNTYFASLGVEKLGEGVVREYAKKFLISTSRPKNGGYERLDLGFAKLPSYIGFNYGKFNLASLCYGQGELAVTPLHIAMIGQAIANDGNMKMPSLIDKVIYPDGSEQLSQRLTDPPAPIKAETAQKLKNYLVNTSMGIFRKDLGLTDKEGNAVRVYSKTGTAELGRNDDICHAYLMCMTDDYVVLISSNRTDASGSSHRDIAEGLLRTLYSE